MPESEQQEGVSILSHGGSATGEGSAAAAAAVAAGSAAMEGSAAEVGGSGAKAGGSGATAAGEGSKGPKESAQQAFARLSNLKKKGSAAYWVDLEPVLVTERVKSSDVQVCKLKCTKGGGACVKLLGISNPARTAHDHYSARGCTGVRQEAGQDKLQQAQAGKRAHPSPMTSSSNKHDIFSKTKNRLALERAKKIAVIKGNSKESTGADEEVMLSVIDVLDD